MRKLRLIAGLGLAVAAFVATSALTFATPDFAKKEKKVCATCHEVKMPKKDTPDACKLTADGKAYQKANVKAADQKCK
jgi:cytochrome c553